MINIKILNSQIWLINDYLPKTLIFISCWAVPIGLVALIVKTPEWVAELSLGITKVYLLLFTSFSIWTPSFVVNSLPFIIQLIFGFGVASTTHSNLTDSSLLVGAKGSGTLTNTGALLTVSKALFVLAWPASFVNWAE